MTKIDDMLLSGLDTTIREMAAATEPPVCNTLFEERQSNLPVEQVSQIRLADPEGGEGYVWTFTHKRVTFGVVLQSDERVPAGTTGRVLQPYDRLDAVHAYRLSDTIVALRDLLAAFRTERDKDGADVFNFNHAGGYGPQAGGDGVPLCSNRHPWKSTHTAGTWSNRFAMPMDLNVVSLDAACTLLSHGFVDGAGLKIRVAPKRLIVHEALAEAAHAALDGLPPENPIERTPVALPLLLSESAWFVQTSIPGFTRFERTPLEFTLTHDENTDTVLVKGYERRCYVCSDPRAVFGSLFEFMP